MLDVFRGLKSLVKISHVHIDSPVFRLHYSLTVMLLSAFSLIVTTRQYVGNPIDCVHTKDIPEDVLNTYCWIHSTYTIKEAFKKKVGVAVPYPGVDNTRGKADDRKTYGYYQWVCFCLFFQVRSRGHRRVLHISSPSHISIYVIARNDISLLVGTCSSELGYKRYARYQR